MARPLPRYTSYPTVPLWTTSFRGDDYGAALERAAERVDEPLSLYVHLPFCRRRCWYCGCNVIAASDPAKIDAYVETVGRELELVGGRLGKRRRLTRIHLGGGTPTALSPVQLRRLGALIDREFVTTTDAERAVEVDPRVTTEAHIECLAQLGFGRLSLGVQDLEPGVQAAIGRLQSEAETNATIESARRHGFTSINVDLVYGLPRQTVESFAATIESILRMRPERVAAFAFAYLPDLLPLQRRLPNADLPAPSLRLALRAKVGEMLEAEGYVAIGMDHWALPGDELAVAQDEGLLWRDFQGYTTRRANETIGVGTSAISDVGGVYAQNTLELSAYRAAIDAQTFATNKGIARTVDDERRREVIVGLLCNLTADVSGFEEPRLSELAAAGLVERRGDRLTVTEQGRPVLRNIASLFDAYLDAAPGRFSSSI